MSSTVIFGSVIVPVLSTQSVSTRASVSMQPMSCTSVRRFASRMTLATSARLVSRYSPSGIMPTMEPTVLVTASTIGLFSHRYSLMNITAPSGMTRKPIHLMRLVSECIISDCGCDPVCLASSVSRETKLSAPTAVSRARQLPDTTKLPESSRSPGFLTISSASPVTSASLTRHSPAATTASAGIWSPGEKTAISSRTSWAASSSTVCPSRTARHFGAAMIFSPSTFFFTRRSCTMPMNILQNTGPRNVKFSHCRTAITQPASRKNRKLKYVKTFFAMISRTDAPGDSTGALPQPPSSRSCACAALKPVSASASKTGISCRCGPSGSFGFRFRNDAATNAVLLQVVADIISHLRQNLSTNCIFSENRKKSCTGRGNSDTAHTACGKRSAFDRDCSCNQQVRSLALHMETSVWMRESA